MSDSKDGIIESLVPHQYRYIDYSPLTELGCHFGVLHLRQIAELGVITFSALQYSIYAMAFAIENKWTPPGLPKRTYLQAFMDAIYNFGVFETPEYLEHLKIAKEKSKKIEKYLAENPHLLERVPIKNLHIAFGTVSSKDSPQDGGIAPTIDPMGGR